MYYEYSKRDTINRATLTINGAKVGRVHFRKNDAWLNPYVKSYSLKGKEELERLGMRVEIDYSNNSFPIKIYVNSSDEETVAKILYTAFLDI